MLHDKNSKTVTKSRTVGINWNVNKCVSSFFWKLARDSDCLTSVGRALNDIGLRRILIKRQLKRNQWWWICFHGFKWNIWSSGL